jgi:integrase
MGHAQNKAVKYFTPLNIEDPNFDRKLDAITAGAKPFVKEHILTKISRENCLTIIDYILAMQTEVSPAQTYRVDTIIKLKHFAEFHNSKPYTDITRQDVVDFLDSLRRPESVDTLHRWVGTYETYRIVLLRFFKWLYSHDLPHNKRPRPAVMDNIPQIRRKEISTYKPTDLWTEEDDLIFYKYCPSVRDRCWHAVSRDTGCRPNELLKLKIKDIITQRLDSGYQIAKITVNGKTGTHTRDRGEVVGNTFERDFEGRKTTAVRFPVTVVATKEKKFLPLSLKWADMVIKTIAKRKTNTIEIMREGSGPGDTAYSFQAIS